VHHGLDEPEAHLHAAVVLEREAVGAEPCLREDAHVVGEPHVAATQRADQEPERGWAARRRSSAART
jgi:hypothetical protein